jgi:hypothetical protein
MRGKVNILSEKEKQKRREYYYTHKEHLKLKMSQYYKSNNDRIKEYKQVNDEKIKSYRKNYYQTNKSKTAEYDLQKRYGISQAQYDELLLKQKGVCLGCGNPPSKRKLDVDHNHTTGKVRGLLCHHCNKAQGQLGENISTFCNLMEMLITDKNIPQSDINILQSLMEKLIAKKKLFDEQIHITL